MSPWETSLVRVFSWLPAALRKQLCDSTCSKFADANVNGTIVDSWPQPTATVLRPTQIIKTTIYQVVTSVTPQPETTQPNVLLNWASNPLTQLFWLLLLTSLFSLLLLSCFVTYRRCKATFNSQVTSLKTARDIDSRQMKRMVLESQCQMSNALQQISKLGRERDQWHETYQQAMLTQQWLAMIRTDSDKQTRLAHEELLQQIDELKTQKTFAEVELQKQQKAFSTNLKALELENARLRNTETKLRNDVSTLEQTTADHALDNKNLSTEIQKLKVDMGTDKAMHDEVVKRLDHKIKQLRHTESRLKNERDGISEMCTEVSLQAAARLGEVQKLERELGTLKFKHETLSGLADQYSKQCNELFISQTTLIAEKHALSQQLEAAQKEEKQVQADGCEQINALTNTLTRNETEYERAVNCLREEHEQALMHFKESTKNEHTVQISAIEERLSEQKQNASKQMNELQETVEKLQTQVAVGELRNVLKVSQGNNDATATVTETPGKHDLAQNTFKTNTLKECFKHEVREVRDLASRIRQVANKMPRSDYWLDLAAQLASVSTVEEVDDAEFEDLQTFFFEQFEETERTLDRRRTKIYGYADLVFHKSVRLLRMANGDKDAIQEVTVACGTEEVKDVEDVQGADGDFDLIEDDAEEPSGIASSQTGTARHGKRRKMRGSKKGGLHQSHQAEEEAGQTQIQATQESEEQVEEAVTPEPADLCESESILSDTHADDDDSPEAAANVHPAQGKKRRRGGRGQGGKKKGTPRP